MGGDRTTCHPPAHVCLVQDQYGMFVADVWKLGHVFQEDDVDIGDAVNALYYQKHKREAGMG